MNPRFLSIAIAALVSLSSLNSWALNTELAVGHSVNSIENGKLLASEEIPSSLLRYRIPPWELLKIPEFKSLFSGALTKQKFTPWIRKLEVVNSIQDNKVCQTTQGIAFIYLGGKPHYVEDTIHIVYFPEKDLLGFRIRDSAVVQQSGDYGWLDPIVIEILSGNTCKGE